MKLTHITAKTLPEAWWMCLGYVMHEGHTYTITRGSHETAQRKELDSLTINIEYPAVRPLVPDTPEGVPPPSSQEYIEQYLPYLMTNDKGKNDLYTYGEDIDKQLQQLIKILKEGGEGTNQACMSIGSADSINLEHSQCLRVIDARIRHGRLHFYVYFRSWDLWGGFPSNLGAIQILKEYVASEVGVEDGEIVAYSKGLHLYSHHWELAKKVLRI